MKQAGLALSAAIALLSLPSGAYALSPAGDPALDAAAAAFRPGQFRWRGDAAPGFPLTIAVSIALQRLYVYRGNVLIGVASVSTGKRGKATPLGDFTILQKRLWHRSNIYSDAPMPFMQRLTWTGIALHSGANPGRPASHGCVRMPPAFAKQLFALTTLGEAVIIADYPLHMPVLLDIDWRETGISLSAVPAPQLPYDTAAMTVD